MSFKTLSIAGLAAATFALPAFAESVITIKDPYARVASKVAKSGAAFMMVENTGDEADQLIDVRTEASKLVQLHTHKDAGDGVMQMRHVPEGFAIPAGGMHMLQRGGDHVMMMGLTGPLDHGDVVTVTLVFEKAGEIEVEIPVDLERKPVHGGHSNHSSTD